MAIEQLGVLPGVSIRSDTASWGWRSQPTKVYTVTVHYPTYVEPLADRVLYQICRAVGHRRREEAPGVHFCPRCRDALIGRDRWQR